MINTKDYKTHLDIMISEIETETTKWNMNVRTMFNHLIAAKRAAERIIKDEEIMNLQGKEYFEATGTDKKNIKIQKPKK